MGKEIYTLNPLFDFQILCDTDLGLYKLIKEDYYDRKVFDNDIFDSEDERFIKTLLLTRDKFNPLFLFCKKKTMKDEELDTLYKEFLNEEYENILKYSKATNIMDLLCISNSIKNVVNATVLCQSQSEIDWIHKYNNKIKCIIGKYENFDLSKYDTLYLKDIYNLLLFNQDTLDMKNIMLPRYLFNLEIASRNIEMPIIEVAQRYYKRNKFMLADPYKDIDVPMSEMI